MTKRSKPEWDQPVVINEDTWAQMSLLARVLLMHDRESDMFDLFNTYREHFLSGWEFTEALKVKYDAEIEKEYNSGKWQ